MHRISIDELGGRDEWLQLRKLGIGGSDAAAVLGASQYSSPMSVYMDKLGLLSESEDNQFKEWGRRLEAPIAQYVQDHIATPLNATVVETNEMYIDSEDTFMVANIDREIHLPDGSIWGLEIKTTSTTNKKKWADGDAPMEYLIQCQHYMAVAPHIEKFILCCLIGGNEFVTLTIERNDDMISMLREKEREFWELVKTKTPPPFDGSSLDWDIIKELYPTANTGEVVDLPESFQSTIDLIQHFDNEIAELKKRIKEYEKERDAHKQSIVGMMGSAEIARIGDRLVKYYNVVTKGHWVKDSQYRRFKII